MQRSSGPWLLGPGPDLVFGCGVGYLVLFPLLLLVLRLTLTDLGAGWIAFTGLVTLLTNSPHYGATLLRVYERREDRRRYAFFAIWISLLIWAAFAAATRVTWIGSVLVTLYLLWAPWHFGAQNYGLALMFLGRGGVRVDPVTKRLLHLSILLSFLLTFLIASAATPTVGLNGIPDDGPGVIYRFISLGIPDGFVALAMPAVGLVYAACSVAAFARLRRRAASWAALAPALLLMLLQASWFSMPALIHWATPAWDPFLTFHVFWFAVAHSVQYLWVTVYYARRSDPPERTGSFLWKCALAGIGITTFPALLFAPGLLGTRPADMGLLFLLFSTVNVHHFMLDGVIWKLRDGRVAKVLLRTEPEASAPITPGSGWSPLRLGAWALGTVSVVVAVATIALDLEYRRALERRDAARFERAVTGLTWVGRESAEARINLARKLLLVGETERGLAEVERSLVLKPTPDAFATLGWLRGSGGDLEGAVEAYRSGLELDPDQKDLVLYLASAYAELDHGDRALEVLEEAALRWPRDPSVRRSLLLARRGRLPAEGLHDADRLPEPGS